MYSTKIWSKQTVFNKLFFWGDRSEILPNNQQGLGKIFNQLSKCDRRLKK